MRDLFRLASYPIVLFAALMLLTLVYKSGPSDSTWWRVAMFAVVIVSVTAAVLLIDRVLGKDE